jgi:hypothetical protein
MSSLEIQIHLTNADIETLVQTEAAAARKILESVHPNRLFSQNHLIFAGEHSLTIYPTASVARVDFVMEGFPNWPFHNEISDILEISEDTFREQYDPQTLRSQRRLTPGEPVRLFVEAVLANRQRVFMEVHVEVPIRDREEELLPIDRNIILQQLFSAPSLYARRRGGGALIINPEHLARLSFYPGPPDTPPNAWPARRA